MEAHDWQTGLVPAYVNTVEWGTPFHGAATVLSSHNKGYQGMFSPEAFPSSGLGWEHLNDGEFAHRGAVNLLKGGLAHATRIAAVSPSYAQEILGDEHGAGLQHFLRGHARKVSGVLNGIDARVWNPATYRHLAANYDAHDLSGKRVCKASLQRESGLPVREDVPIFGVASRFPARRVSTTWSRSHPRLPEHHGRFLYNPLVHVPLAIRLPGQPGRRIDDPVSVLDITPTVLQMIGAAIPPGVHGHSLLPDLLPGAPASLRTLSRPLVLNESDQFGVIVWPYKLLVRPGDNLTELYDLSADFGERQNLAESTPHRVGELMQHYYPAPAVNLDRSSRGRRLRERAAAVDDEP